MRDNSFAFILLISFILTSTVSADSTQEVSASVTEAGIYRFQARKKKPILEPNAIGGKRNIVRGIKLVRKTTIIPARLGLSFGFRYTIKGTSKKNIVLNMVHSHPSVVNPKTGKSINTSTYRLKSKVGETYTSFTFEEEWEMVTGKWTFGIWHNGKKLLEQSFTVVPNKAIKL